MPKCTAIVHSGLNANQLKFCEEYLRNGMNAPKAAEFAGYSKNMGSAILRSQNVQDYIENRVRVNMEVIQLDYDYKIRKLKKVIETAIPDDIERVSRETTIGLQAISEANKMQGHYSAEKHISVNANIEMTHEQQEARLLIESLQKQYERDY